jgi:hypothetical protein
MRANICVDMMVLVSFGYIFGNWIRKIEKTSQKCMRICNN